MIQVSDFFSNKRSTFPLIFLAILLVYGHAWQAGLVSDWTGTAWRIEHSRGAIDILTNFGFPSNQQLLNLMLFVTYKAFGNQPLGWHLLFCLLHAINGWLFYLVLRELAASFKVALSPALFWFATAIFLFHPNQNEPVMWKACLNWLASTGCILASILALLRWNKGQSTRLLLLVHACFLAGLLLLEQALVFPLYAFALFLVLWREEKSEHAGRWAKAVFLPMAGLLGGYLLLNKFTLGAWVGHYGAATHLKIDPAGMGATMLKYFSKILIWSRYTISDKGAHYGFFEQEWLVLSIALFLTATAVMTWIYWKKIPGHVKVGCLLGAFTIISLLPVSNLFFYHLLYVENDRYAYLPSGFLAAALIFLIAGTPRWLSIPALSAYVVVCLYYLLFTIGLWKDNARILYALIEDYRWTEDEAVYVLNVPDNNQGIRLFRDYGDGTGLHDHLVYCGGLQLAGQPEAVLGYNLTKPADGVAVSQPNDSTLTVVFEQWGNWWWHNGLGAIDYETDRYRVAKDGRQYHLTIKDLPQGAVLIYQDSLGWKEWPLAPKE